MKKSILLIALLALFGSCKKQQIPDPAYANAYARFVFIDAPGQAKLQFYMDGKINANGDSSVNSPDGSVYQPDNSIPTTTLINIPSGGWTDNSPVSFSGTYGYNNLMAAGYKDFPNPTDRIGLAPVIDGINYFNWAALSATTHQLTLYSVQPASLYGNEINVRGDKFLDQPIQLEGGALQTFFLINEGPCKLFLSGGINASAGLPIYDIEESLNYYSNSFGLVSVKDHPDKLPHFKDSSAYIRFMNLTPTYADQTLNANTQTIDVYLAPIYGTNPDVYSSYESGFTNSMDSLGPEFLVAKGLNRFESTVDAPFYEMDVSANMRNNNAGPNDTLRPAGTPRVPRYYRVLVYTAGRSSATGDQPLAQNDWLAVYSQFAAFDHFDDLGNNTPLGTEVDSWLLRSDGTNYHPSICTIPIAVSNEAYPLVINTNWLSFRSCINYVKAGVNDIYFNQ